MYPKYHILLGFLFSSLVLFIFPEIKPIGFFTIWLSSILIDADHYLLYLFAKKDYNLKNAFKWFDEDNKKSFRLPKKERFKLYPPPCVLHGIETIIILIILSFFSKFFAFILVGVIFHQILDLIWMRYHGFNIYHIGFRTYNILNYKRQKK